MEHLRKIWRNPIENFRAWHYWKVSDVWHNPFCPCLLSLLFFLFSEWWLKSIECRVYAGEPNFTFFSFFFLKKKRKRKKKVEIYGEREMKQRVWILREVLLLLFGIHEPSAWDYKNEKCNLIWSDQNIPLYTLLNCTRITFVKGVKGPRKLDSLKFWNGLLGSSQTSWPMSDLGIRPIIETWPTHVPMGWLCPFMIIDSSYRYT